MGAWVEAPLDPSLWGLGNAPLTAFVVRDACLRLLRLRAAAEMPASYAPCCAVVPRLWAAADGGPDHAEVGRLAARQRGVYAARLRGLQRSAGASALSQGRLSVRLRYHLQQSRHEEIPIKKMAGVRQSES